MVDANITGQKSLSRMFHLLGSRAVISGAQAGVRKAASEVSKSAKRIVHREARKDGHLERSIGVAVMTNYRTAVVTAEVGPRTSYTAAAKKGRRAITPIGKGRERLNHPAVYGLYIESGRHGKQVRRMGGVHYMRRGLEARQDEAVTDINSAIAKKIKSIASKKGI